ncbi:MAG: hypothetical protein KDD40_10435, partial [Bdellovibrionales bacterium]|nr:hypothetical protein [Bdellovibrionales bacterium]
GDVLVAFPSSGFHSNGYSLLRKVFADDLESWQEELLKPTRLYHSLIADLRKNIEIHALAHITGGGMDNILRVLPEGHAVELQAWRLPNPFLEVKKRAEMSWPSLLTTLNCGVGLVMYLKSAEFAKLTHLCQQKNYEFWPLGKVVKAPQKVWQLNFSEMEELQK